MARPSVSLLFSLPFFFACSQSASDPLDDSSEGGAGGEDDGHGHEHTGGSAGSDEGCDAPAACELIECAIPLQNGQHVAPCTELSPHSNPPTSGPHYPQWAAFGIYDEPMEVGFLLHSIEHSAVALLYNCDLYEADGGDCDELKSELEAFYNSWPADPLCEDVPHRLLIVPDPSLDVPFAATAWGFHLKGSCFDADRVSAFIDAHYGNNYEDLCNTGIDPHNPGCAP